MLNDPIVAEVHAIREKLAAEFNYDIHTAFEDMRRRQCESGHPIVSQPPRSERPAVDDAPATPLSLTELTRRAFDALTRELGLADTLRFVSQFSNGQGDYTVDRDAHFAGKSVDDIINEIKAKQKAA